jgi:hypothetical protein
MQIKEHLHHASESQLSASTIQEVRNTIQASDWPKRQSSKEFRANLLHALSTYGWSNSVRIDHRSKISITSVLGQTGLCIQTGNMSRFYADLLKLETLYRKKLIIGAIYIIPTKAFARELSGNVAHFERLVEELQIFDATLTIPLVVFGISGREK